MQRERDRDLPERQRQPRKPAERGEVQEATQGQQERFGETLLSKRKRDRDRCVRKRRGRAAEAQGRVTETEPPQGLRSPDRCQQGVSHGNQQRGAILPETCWNAETEDQRQRQRPGSRDTPQVWDLEHVASPRCASVALSVKWGHPRHPPQTPVQGDSEFTPVKSHSQLSVDKNHGHSHH